MKADYRELTPEEAWDVLPSREWNGEAAAHLLRRIGFAALPNAVEEATKKGLEATLGHFFEHPRKLTVPIKIERSRERKVEMVREARALPPELRKELMRELRRESREAMLDYELKWMIFARQPQNSPQEKFVLFLQDVFVTGMPKIRDASLLFAHQALLREHMNSRFDTLCKAVSRSPAMIQYLDLQRSTAGAPNENFARELFELFTLGEGNYTESDVKEAARAFTGYRTDGTHFKFVYRRYDAGRKTIFSQSGRWSGDDVIDMVLEQPAARTFLPGELLRFYLSADVALAIDYLNKLGEHWAADDFNLAALRNRIFRSRLFFHRQFRGNLIKSPIQFYLGMLQETALDVPPFPSIAINAMRNMGQPFFAPPNVRGWVGGKAWINSSTLAARRQAVEWHFSPLKAHRLNADDYAELMVAQQEGRADLTFLDRTLDGLLDRSNDEIVDLVLNRFVPAPKSPALRAAMSEFLRAAPANRRLRLNQVRDLVKTLLQSPHYQLC